MIKPTVILERSPYRYVQCGLLEINGRPDYRIQKMNEWTKRYQDMYYLDNQMQLDTCLEDPEYTKWLDPDPDVCAYRKFNSVRNPYVNAITS
jgi:hypothetical protein